MSLKVICEKCEHKFDCPKKLKPEYDLFLLSVPFEERQEAKVAFIVPNDWCPKCRTKT